MISRPACHREDFTVAIFVADGADFFGGEVVFWGDVEGIVGEHGGGGEGELILV